MITSTLRRSSREKPLSLNLSSAATIRLMSLLQLMKLWAVKEVTSQCSTKMKFRLTKTVQIRKKTPSKMTRNRLSKPRIYPYSLSLLSEFMTKSKGNCIWTKPNIWRVCKDQGIMLLFQKSNRFFKQILEAFYTLIIKTPSVQSMAIRHLSRLRLTMSNPIFLTKQLLESKK